MDSSGCPSNGAMSLDYLDNIDTSFLFTPSGARIQNSSAELRPPTPTGAIPADPVTSSPRGAPKKKREVTCPICKVKGHMRKTCPTTRPATTHAGSSNLRTLSVGSNLVTENQIRQNVQNDPNNARNDETANSDDENEDEENADEEEYLDPIVRELREQEQAAEGQPQQQQNQGGRPLPWFDETKWTPCEIENPPQRVLRDANTPLSSIPPSSVRYKGAHNTGGATTELELFRLLYDDDICDQYVRETNSYVRNQNNENNSLLQLPLTRDVLLMYFGLILYMGVFQLHADAKLYWSKGKWGSAYVSSIMSRKRFFDIDWSLHWLDNSQMSGEERARRNKADGFWSVESYLEKLKKNFQKYYEPKRYLSIDEMCIHFKGRMRCKCYNPNKPNKWHLKAYCLNEAESGYLHNFFMYRGKDEDRPANINATLWPIQKLTETELYHKKDYVMATDNWYTQLAAAELLCNDAIGMAYLGTIKTNRTGVPKKALFPKKGKNVKARGEMTCFKATTDNGLDVYFTSWQDSKPVHMISTFPTYKDTCRRHGKDGTGNYVPREISRPTIVPIYNSCMGGTDKLDQYNCYYELRKRSLKWQKRILLHFMRTSVTNAYVLHQDLHVRQSDQRWNGGKSKKQALRDYISTLIDSLCSSRQDDENNDNEEEKEEERPVKKAKNRSDLAINDFKSRNCGKHTPETVSHDKRLACKVCKQRSSHICKECGVHLHIECWSTWHDKENPWA
jgi:hypothetical protein